MRDNTIFMDTGAWFALADESDQYHKQAGILSVDSNQALLDTAKALASCTIPSGPGVAVLSGQADPAMAACDVCESKGLDIARFSEKTQNRINDLLPPLALRTNPVDMGPAWYDSAAIRGIVRGHGG